jgi:chemotaxis protein CheX
MHCANWWRAGVAEAGELDFSIFVVSVKRFFEKTTGTRAAVGAPYLADRSQMPALDFTGIIAITGAARGSVYFTAPRAMLAELTVYFSGSLELSDENCADCTGEVANIVAGNARERFGAGFAISYPIVVRGPLLEVQLPRHVRSAVVPVDWRRHRCFVVISLEPVAAARAGG